MNFCGKLEKLHKNFFRISTVVDTRMEKEAPFLTELSLELKPPAQFCFSMASLRKEIYQYLESWTCRVKESECSGQQIIVFSVIVVIISTIRTTV